MADRAPYDQTTFWLRVDNGGFVKTESFDQESHARAVMLACLREPHRSIELTKVVTTILETSIIPDGVNQTPPDMEQEIG